MGVTIPMVIERGGDTKTTSTFGLGHAFARETDDWTVILVDLDQQMSLTKWVAPEYVSQAPASIVDVLIDPNRGLMPAALDTRFPRLKIVPGARTLGMPDPILSKDPTGQPRNPYTVLRRAVKSVPDKTLVLLDCGPGLGLIQSNAIVAADRLIIPVSPDPDSREGFMNIGTTIVQMLNNDILTAVPEVSVLLVKILEKRRQARKTLDYVGPNGQKSYHVFETYIRFRESGVKDAREQNKSLFELTKTGDLGRDYRSVARELLALLETAAPLATAG